MRFIENQDGLKNEFFLISLFKLIEKKKEHDPK